MATRSAAPSMSPSGPAIPEPTPKAEILAMAAMKAVRIPRAMAAPKGTAPRAAIVPKAAAGRKGDRAPEGGAGTEGGARPEGGSGGTEGGARAEVNQRMTGDGTAMTQAIVAASLVAAAVARAEGTDATSASAERPVSTKRRRLPRQRRKPVRVSRKHRAAKPSNCLAILRRANGREPRIRIANARPMKRMKHGRNRRARNRIALPKAVNGVRARDMGNPIRPRHRRTP